MNPLVAWFLGSTQQKMTASYSGLPAHGFHHLTVKKKGGHDKSNLPRFYPGAKLARKAVMGRIGRIHHGLHAEFTYTRHAKSKGL